MEKLTCKKCGGTVVNVDGTYICADCGELFDESNSKASEEINAANSVFSEGVPSDIIMKIDDVFTVSGRGTVVVGALKKDVKIGASVSVNDMDCSIAGIEFSRQLIPSATAGMTVGLLLKNAPAYLKKGDEVKPLDSDTDTDSPEAIARELVASGKYNKLDGIKELRERCHELALQDKCDELSLREVKEIYEEAEAQATGVSYSSKSGGCYVATAVYGSYDCPEVWTLRRYRDGTLAKTWYGRAFIKVYYAISPTLVKLFGKTAWFKKMWKGRLDRMVLKLQNDGVESTPYCDKEW